MSGRCAIIPNLPVKMSVSFNITFPIIVTVLSKTTCLYSSNGSNAKNEGKGIEAKFVEYRLSNFAIVAAQKHWEHKISIKQSLV